MSNLTVTAKGQVTLRKAVLQHLGVAPGEKIAVELLPDGRAAIRAATPEGRIDSFVGLLAGRSRRKLTIAEINRIAAEGWAGVDEDRG